MRKVGITMRSSDSPYYPEARDAIARDWYRLLGECQLQWQWVLLPNLGRDTLEYALSQGVNALLLTGGDDLGVYQQRDEAEVALLEYAQINGWPVLGICRGMQSLNAFFGGKLVAADKAHVGHSHPLELAVSLPWSPHLNELNVNSFHSQGVAEPSAEFTPLAWHLGICEAFEHNFLPWVGVMWHPERQVPLELADRLLFEYVFGV